MEKGTSDCSALNTPTYRHAQSFKHFAIAPETESTLADFSLIVLVAKSWKWNG
jgi:hypothetical protein